MQTSGPPFMVPSFTLLHHRARISHGEVYWSIWRGQLYRVHGVDLLTSPQVDKADREFWKNWEMKSRNEAEPHRVWRIRGEKVHQWNVKNVHIIYTKWLLSKKLLYISLTSSWNKRYIKQKWKHPPAPMNREDFCWRIPTKRKEHIK